jgi:EAL domain-containing protein (putative c-di-GMP-specific phosphodiesterase class I)
LIAPLIDRILAPGGVRTLLQPVYRTSGAARALHAVECLARGPLGSNAESAPILFDYVRRKREEPRVDRACIAAGLSAVREVREEVRVCVNVHASTLGRDETFPAFFAALLKASRVEAERIVLELVEHAPALDLDGFARSLHDLRDLGMRLAIDDLGIGSSNLRLLVECKPDYVKLDRYFVSGANKCARKRAVLAAVIRLAAELGAEIIAEGVESQAELELVRSLGVDLVQGYLFSKALPAAELALAEPEAFRSAREPAA